MQTSATTLVLYGFLTWLIPFAISVPFFGKNGQPLIPIATLKSLMIVVGSGVGAWLLVRVFRRRPRFARAGLIVGLLWLALNLILDLSVLVPLSRMSLPDYFGEIALRYVTIPIMSVAIDSVASSSRVGEQG